MNTNASTKLDVTDREGLRVYLEAGDKIAEAAKAHVEAIRAKVAVTADAKNAADTGKTAKAGIWAETLEVVKIIAEATKDAKTGKWREQLFTDVMGEFMQKGEGEKASTAAAYASTGRAVLVKLLPRMTVEEITAKSYKEVRTLVSPPKNAEADGIAKRIADMVNFIRRNADKHGGDNKAVPRLERIEAFTRELYTPVKGAKDASGTAAKAAKELDANKQVRPEQAGAVETTATDKPEAPKQAANG